MNDKLPIAIEVLSAKIKNKEFETNELKKMVNELCGDAGIAILYPGLAESNAGGAPIRSDEYYGQTLTAAIRNYLERRKSHGLGAATPAEIFGAIKEGGYKFETDSEVNAKISVGNTLRKTSSIFHRLPNGEYGLLSWYPGAKEKPETEPPDKEKDKAEKRSTSAPANGTEVKPEAQKVTNEEIRDVALAQQGNFKTSDIFVSVKAKFPQKEVPATKIPTVLFALKEKGLIKEVSPRNGSTPAVYAKA